MHNQQVGQHGEDVARRLLSEKGFQILATNYRAGRWGELDLVCRDGDVLVFVEVKTRHTERFGQAIEAVSRGKCQRLLRAAQYYKLTHPDTPPALRFDVVAIDYSGSTASVVHVANVEIG